MTTPQGLRADIPPHALERYAPDPKNRREGIGLCLSGGGYRAALFHLGALRRLNEFGLIGKLRTISSVSGGSIISAHLAKVLRWPVIGVVPDWENRVAKPFRKFTERNIRTGPVLTRLLPWNWTKESTGVEELAERYAKYLTDQKLSDLPKSPDFVFCAADMAFGANWETRGWRIGDYQAGYVDPHPGDWPVAKAVGASSCFPPVFNPLPIEWKQNRFKGGYCPPGKKRDAAFEDLRLTDGGNYDNLGLEPIWKTHAVVLSSDGGGTFDFQSDKGLFSRLGRYPTLLDNQARAVRKRWLISSFINDVMDGAYWGVGSARSSYDPGDNLGYSKEIAADVIAEIRTDLDRFSEAEQAVLENHGYFLADAAIRKHAPTLVPSPPPLVAPHPGWVKSPEELRAALKGSNKRKKLGRH